MKRFLLEKLQDYQKYLQQNLPILDKNGDEQIIINLDFNENINEFLENYSEIESLQKDNQQALQETSLLKSKFDPNANISNEQNGLIDAIKFTDEDLEEFFIVLLQNRYFQGEIIISDHNITNQTSIRICKILSQNCPKIIGLSLNNITRFTYICGENLGNSIRTNTTLRKLHLNHAKLGTQGANRIIEGIKLNQYIQDYDFGQLTNTSLLYLIKYLSEEHSVKNLSFSEDLNEIWEEKTKNLLLNTLRDNSYNKQILSVDIYSERLEENQNFIAEISILCQNNRTAEITKKNNEYKSKELNTNHFEYYDGDNHVKNAFTFSVKSYMSNVIETLLDEGLYYLEKERANIIRDEKIFEISKEHINKQILDDIFKSEGSLLVLAKYMINKINKTNNE